MPVGFCLLFLPSHILSSCSHVAAANTHFIPSCCQVLKQNIFSNALKGLEATTKKKSHMLHVRNCNRAPLSAARFPRVPLVTPLSIGPHEPLGHGVLATSSDTGAALAVPHSSLKTELTAYFTCCRSRSDSACGAEPQRGSAGSTDLGRLQRSAPREGDVRRW